MSLLTRALLSVVLLSCGLGAGGAEAAGKIRVVATTTDLKALTEAVGGKLVDVDALARGNQNPHDLEVRPSLMVKVRQADLLIMNGLELDQWAEVVVQGAHNPKWTAPGATCIQWAIPTTRPIRAWPRPSPRTSSPGSLGLRPGSGPSSSGTGRNSWPAWTRPWDAGRPTWPRSRGPRSSWTTTCGSTS